MIPNTKPTNAKFNHAKSAGTGKNLTFANKLSTAGTASLKVEVTVEYKLNNPVNATVHTQTTFLPPKKLFKNPSRINTIVKGYNKTNTGTAP